MSHTRNYVRLAEAAPHICDGDLLQFRPRAWRIGEQLTAIAGRGEHCHSALAAWWGPRDCRLESTDCRSEAFLSYSLKPPVSSLMCLESRLTGIRAVTLRSQVERFAGRIDVYETNLNRVFPRFSQAAMVAAMREKTGRAYGVGRLLRTMLTHTLLVRLIVRAMTADNGHDRSHLGPEFCSQAIASAARIAGGEDPVGALGDGSTEPNDLTRSALFNHNGAAYRFTLIP